MIMMREVAKVGNSALINAARVMHYHQIPEISLDLYM